MSLILSLNLFILHASITTVSMTTRKKFLSTRTHGYFPEALEIYTIPSLVIGELNQKSGHVIC